MTNTSAWLVKSVTNNYSVYKHTCPNGKVYIGITCRPPKWRWNNGKKYESNKHFTRAIKKYGWDNITHEIVATNLSKEDACKMEMELIARYKSTDRKYGYNKSTGGECGAVGVKQSRRSIEKRRKSAIRYYADKSHRRYGKDSSKARAINQYNLLGDLLKSWDCGADIRNELGFCTTGIYNCCRFKYKSSNGFLWLYKDEANRIAEKVLQYNSHYKYDVERLEKHRNKMKGIIKKNRKDCSKPVKGTNVKTGEVIVFPSMYEAERNGFKATRIGKCCSPKYIDKTAFGYRWEYLNGDAVIGEEKSNV